MMLRSYFTGKRKHSPLIFLSLYLCFRWDAQKWNHLLEADELTMKGQLEAGGRWQGTTGALPAPPAPERSSSKAWNQEPPGFLAAEETARLPPAQSYQEYTMQGHRRTWFLNHDAMPQKAQAEKLGAGKPIELRGRHRGPRGQLWSQQGTSSEAPQVWAGSRESP